MKNLIQNFIRLFGYELRKFNPYPNTFIPINILEYIFFKISKSKKNITCVVLDNKKFLEHDYIYKTINKYKIKINYFKSYGKNKLNLLDKNNFNLIIINKKIEISLLKKIVKDNIYYSMVILNSKNLSNKSVYNCNMFVLNSNYEIYKYWYYIIYFKNI